MRIGRASGSVDRPRRRLRTRLFVAMVAIAFGVLVVAGFGAVGIARQTASAAAIRDLKQKAKPVATELDTLGSQFRTNRLRVNATQATRTCQLVTAVLRISSASVVVVTADGNVEEGVAPLLGSACANQANLALPRDVKTSDLNVDQILVGQQQSGVTGSTAFVVDPLSPVGSVTPALVLTQGVDTRPLGRAGPYLFLTGAIALLVAALVSAYLARRMTRPIAAMRDAAQRIAGGDLSARVGGMGQPEPGQEPRRDGDGAGDRPGT
jgi:hypothetical protein